MVTSIKSLTLEAFLQLPETEPASEFICGQISQKPMPQGEHSRLQGKLCAVINQVAIVLPEQRIQLLTESASLPVLTNVPLALTVDQVFSWLAL